MTGVLQIRIDDIKDAGLDLALAESSERFPALVEMAAAGECSFVEPIRISLHVVRVGEMIEVEGTFESQVRFTCSRCLREFSTPLGSGFAVTFARELPEVADESSGDEVELSAEAMGLVLFSGDEINLTEAVQEQVVMALPMRPLCREACRGLCPQCGADLNERDCGCERPVFGAKFAALKDFKTDKNK